MRTPFRMAHLELMLGRLHNWSHVCRTSTRRKQSSAGGSAGGRAGGSVEVLALEPLAPFDPPAPLPLRDPLHRLRGGCPDMPRRGKGTRSETKAMSRCLDDGSSACFSEERVEDRRDEGGQWRENGKGETRMRRMGGGRCGKRSGGREEEEKV